MNEEDQEFSEEDAVELEKLQKSLESAISSYSELRAKRHGFPGAYVHGFALYVEFISPDLVQNDATSGFVVVPPDQPGSMSRGMFEFGAETYNRQAVRIVKS